MNFIPPFAATIEPAIKPATMPHDVTTGHKPHIHISGRRWFRRSAGNTYCKVRVYGDGVLMWESPEFGGYGDHYLTVAADWLRAHGCPEMEYGTRYLREVMGGTYDVCDVARERDL